MAFFTQAVNVLKILVMAVGAGLGAWGVINLMEGDMVMTIPVLRAMVLSSLWLEEVSFLSDLSSFYYLPMYSIKKKRRA